MTAHHRPKKPANALLLKSKFLVVCSILLVLYNGCQPSGEQKAQAEEPPLNVLMILVDDLRPELGCYGASHIHSPNIDRLAANSLRYERAYCQVPIFCSSRASLLTGTYPTRHRFTSARTYAEVDRPEAKVLPALLRENGYYTISNGKIFDRVDDHVEAAWSEPPYRLQGTYRWTNYLSDENIRLDSVLGLGLPWEKMEVEDTAYFDGKIAEKTIQDLRKLQENKQPFFIAMGLLKPHLPFNVPAKYWDLYDPNAISLPDHQKYHPGNAPEQAFFPWTELLSYHGVAEGPLSDSLARQLIHGYYACVSYADAQVGRVLDTLDQLGLTENTIVVLAGDHGWHLGEHGLWCKKYNFQEALRVPLLVKVPGVEASKRSEVVELVDLYPTITALTGIEAPSQLVGDVLVSEGQPVDATEVSPAFSKWNDALTIIDPQYSYTVWKPSADSAAARMLYNLTHDPQEMNNLANQPDYASVVDSLERVLYEQLPEDCEKLVAQ